MTSDHPSFEDFFAALHQGLEPLPWQSRLANEVASHGWPDEIGVPTGLGKTACLDIAVWTLAAQAGLPPAERSLPTRIWYVVNRRLLVDAAADHGTRMERLLDSPELLGVEYGDRWGPQDRHLEALKLVSQSVRRIGAVPWGGPLHTLRLRGGAELGQRPRDPAQPCLIFATIPMFASRWLFRGYGSSTSMRPIDAALAGTDSLVLLDEAHLAGPLASLVEPLAACDPGAPSRILPAGRCRPRFVALTATGSRGTRFDLDEQDHHNPIVMARLGAAKPTSLVETTVKDLARTLVQQAIALLAEPSRRSCLVFANTPDLARRVHDGLTADHRDVWLVTGRAREAEADAVRKQLLDSRLGVPAGRSENLDRPPLWIVATQTLEVGADLDVDALVTQSAGVRALVQRFGRLNRLGTRPTAAAVVCHAPDLEDKLYGNEPAIAWERLRAAGAGISLSPGLVGEILGEPAEELPRGREPLPGLVWEWAKTSLRLAHEAPPEAYFGELDENLARVSVCWRAYRPPSGLPLLPRVSAEESVELPLGELRAVLKERGWTSALRLADDKATVDEAEPGQLRPGDVVILSAEDGLYDKFGWNATSSETVRDVSLGPSLTLPLAKQAFNNLVMAESIDALLRLVQELKRADEEDRADTGFDESWVAEMIASLRVAEPLWGMPASEWGAYCDGLASEPKLIRPEIEEGPYYLVGKGRPHSARRVPVRVDAFDELSFDVGEMGQLTQHQEGVGVLAGAMARHLGVPPALCEAVVRGGRWHDIGKSDPRFQRWLDPTGLSTELLAKSAGRLQESQITRAASGWPKGGRHEAISSQLVQAWMEVHSLPEQLDVDLVVHLVASHHGNGRPSLPVVNDSNGITVKSMLDGSDVVIQADLGMPDWEQPARFRRLCERYGYWGLALLEALVRLADHLASGAVAG
ncbi:MAG: type I-G CRISPR-associated helicase/endonuclease Cas3g [Acidimicrobiales bacterium]